MPKDFDPMDPPRRVFLYGKCCLGREKYPLILSYPAFFQIFTTKKEAPLSKNLLFYRGKGGIRTNDYNVQYINHVWSSVKSL